MSSPTGFMPNCQSQDDGSHPTSRTAAGVGTCAKAMESCSAEMRAILGAKPLEPNDRPGDLEEPDRCSLPHVPPDQGKRL